MAFDPVGRILGFAPKDKVKLDGSKNAQTYAPPQQQKKPEPNRPVVYTTIGRYVPPRRWF